MTQSEWVYFQGWCHEHFAWVSFTELHRELTSGAGMTALYCVGVAVFVVLLSIGIYKFQQRVQTTYDYNVFDWVNLLLHTALWMIFWGIMIFGGYGHTVTVGGEGVLPAHQVVEPGCPLLSTMIMLGLFMIPTWRTNRTVQNWGESIGINFFQTIIGFVVGSLIMFALAFSKHSSSKE